MNTLTSHAARTIAIAAFLALVTFGARVSGAQGFVVKGQMHHTTLEGGCWYMQSDDGKKYELWGDSAVLAGLHVEGTHATLRVEGVHGAASICMVGEIVRIIRREDLPPQTHDLSVNEVTLSGTVHRTKSGVWYLESSTSGSKMRYEFQAPPAAKYRHVKAIFRERVRLVSDPTKTKEHMDGLILAPRSPKPTAKGARKAPAPDPR